MSYTRQKKHEPKQLRPCCEHAIVEPNGRTIEHSNGIPLDLLIELNQVTSVSELFLKFMPHINMHGIVEYRMTSDDNNQNSTIVPKAATCTTENRTVSLRDDDNPSLYYSPPCTRVKRCGGCCGSNLVSCQPTEVEMLNFEVTILQYNETFTFKEKKIVTVEQHVKCKCDCVVKEQDCKAPQVYNVNECQCVCDSEDQEKCDSEQEEKFWDSKTCTCRCIEEQECTTGFVFNYNTCKCEPAEDTL